MSIFSSLLFAPVDPILGLSQAFARDPHPHKVDLGIGLFCNEKLQIPILHAVQIAEEKLLHQEKSKQYLPIEGDLDYLEEVGALLFGSTCWKADRVRIASFQTPGGTGALFLGASLLKQEMHKSDVWVSDPSWPNHRAVMSRAGFAVHSYPYYSFEEKGFCFSKLYEVFSSLPPFSVVVLQGCCHNPTGIDLSIQEWQEVCSIIKKKKLIPFFDMAYQGLGEGIEEDGFAIRHALDEGIEFFVAVSLSKNFSLYSERVGALFIVSSDSSHKEKIISQARKLIRTNYSNPPSHGAKIVKLILSNPTWRAIWEEEVFFMRSRLYEARLQLGEALSHSSRFPHLGKGKGMFAFLALTDIEVSFLIEKYGIYLSKGGRINLSGLTKNNLPYVVQAIAELEEK